MGVPNLFLKHANDTDLYIQADITIAGVTKPIELIGTGFLQLIQIFSYVLLFKQGNSSN